MSCSYIHTHHVDTGHTYPATADKQILATLFFFKEYHLSDQLTQTRMYELYREENPRGSDNYVSGYVYQKVRLE